MKTIPIHLLAFAILVASCSKDSPVAPPDEPSPQNTATVVVGTSGGTLACEGFSLTVPPGAFSSAETLVVEEEAYTGTDGTYLVTNQYRLKGLPSTFAGELTLALRCRRTPAGGTSLFVGRDALELLTRSPLVVDDPMPADVDSGYLKAQLIVTGGMGRTKRATVNNGSADLRIRGFDQVARIQSSGNHFTIICLEPSRTIAGFVASTMEEAYSECDRMGYNGGVYGKARWPMLIVVMPDRIILGPVSVSGVASALFGTQVYVDEMASMSVEFRKQLFGVFMLLVCTLQDPKGSPATIWPYFAIAGWAGARAAPAGADPAPPFFRGQQLAPFHGMHVTGSPDPGLYGFGMAGLMKYIADTYDESGVLQIYKTIPGSTHAIDALLTSLPEPEYVWWPGFMKRYIAGEIYGVQADTLLQTLSLPTSPEVFTVGSLSDTVKYFSQQFADLSAKLYRVNLEYADISPGATITFEVGPPSLNFNYVTAMVFGLKDHTLEYWESGRSVTVTKLKDLTAAGYDIVVAVINSANEPPYTGSMAIDLDVTVGAERVVRASIKTRTSGIMVWDDGSRDTTNFVVYNVNNRVLEGSLVNGLFTATSQYSSGVIRLIQWTIHFDFSTTPPRVRYFRAEETETSAGETETWTVESSPTCDIAGYPPAYGGYLFKVQGEEVRKHLLPVQNRLENPSIGYGWEVSETLFDEASYIEIYLE
jgi:hypothetical protein